MAITVKKIVLWRKEIENKPGVLADVLQPIAAAGADLQVVMGYRYPSDETKAALEVYPVAGKKSIAAAQAAGLVTAPIPTLLVEGDNRAGVGAVVARAMADAGINIGFLVAQVIGRKYSAVIGFDSDADASKATTLIKKATASKRK
jgi:hypothetical protein